MHVKPVHIYTHMHACTCATCTHVYTCMLEHARVRARMYSHACLHKCVCAHELGKHVPRRLRGLACVSFFMAYAHIHIYTHIQPHTHVVVRTYTHIYAYTITYTQALRGVRLLHGIRTYTHIYAYTTTYTHIYAYTTTYTQACVCVHI